MVFIHDTELGTASQTALQRTEFDWCHSPDWNCMLVVNGEWVCLKVDHFSCSKTPTNCQAPVFWSKGGDFWLKRIILRFYFVRYF